MSFLRKGTRVGGFCVVSRLDKGKRNYREVYLTTKPSSDGDEEKCVLVVYDYELTRQAGKLTKNAKSSLEIRRMRFFLEDTKGLSKEPGEYVNAKGRRFQYAAYPYKEGIRLDQMMSEMNANNKIGIEFMSQLCSLANDVHVASNRGSHNAISPDNVLVFATDEGFQPLLFDFANTSKTSKTLSVTDIETLDHRFRAPETFSGEFSIYSDVYALGMMLCYIFGGDSIWDYSLDQLRKMSEKQRHKASLEMSTTALERAKFPSPDYYDVAKTALDPKPIERYFSPLIMRYELMHVPTEMKVFDELCNKLLANAAENSESELELFADETPSKKTKKLHGDDLVDAIVAEADAEVNKELDDIWAKRPKPIDPADLIPFDDFGMKDDGRQSVNLEITKPEGAGFADVAGMAELKQLLKRNFIDIIKHRDKAKMYNIEPSNGILLYGPPGCGKTYMAEKIAEEANLNFVMVKPSDLGSTYIHGSQTKIADLFKKAEEKAPALICFDEFDTLVPSRREDSHHTTLTEVNEFLVQLNNCASRGVYVLAMSNNINMIDTAVLRKGRIDEVIYVPEPDFDARREMFRIELGKCMLVAKEINCDKLADMTRGYTSSDIAYIVKEALREAFRQSVEVDEYVTVDQQLLERVVQQTQPSISEKDIKRYEAMRDEYINKKKQTDLRPRIGFAV